MYQSRREFQLCTFRNSKPPNQKLPDSWPHLGYEKKKLVFLADKRSDDWFLMNSVWAPLTVIALYIYFIFNLGPRLMKNRPPMQLDTVIKIYDIIQVILNCYIAERVSNNNIYW
jgi:hypothetical protein